jgi:arsenical pump membrane protein
MIAALGWPSAWAVWAIAGTATAGVILRPLAWPECVWAVAGAVLLVALGLLPPADALAGVAKGTDVYLFLLGMMLLAELARREALFDWLAAHAARRARGSAARLFTLVYGVGVVVTVFLSNDATAVVLTPAVAAVARAAAVADPLPYLLVCAFIANAASFVLPISNPANLVLYASHMPPLAAWLGRYGPASVASIAATYAVLRWTQAGALRQSVAASVQTPALTGGGVLAAAGIAGTAAVLLGCSALGLQLGLPTFLAGLATAAPVLARRPRGAGDLLRHISWDVVPLVAGLFVLVAALERTGATAALAGLLREGQLRSSGTAAVASGAVLAVACNLLNNLPAGLLAAGVATTAQAPERVRAALLVGVDLGPNLSVTGSLATILWLAALRREGLRVGAWRFLRLGAVVMPPALVLALAAVVASR